MWVMQAEGFVLVERVTEHLANLMHGMRTRIGLSVDFVHSNAVDCIGSSMIGMIKVWPYEWLGIYRGMPMVY